MAHFAHWNNRRTEHAKRAHRPSWPIAVRVAVTADKPWRWKRHRLGDRNLARFQENNAALATISADADNGALSRRPRGKFLHGLAQYPRTRCAKRMAKGNAAAVRIQSLPWKCSEYAIDAGLLIQEVAAFESLDVSQDLSSKGFVNLPEIYVGIRKAIAR